LQTLKLLCVLSLEQLNSVGQHRVGQLGSSEAMSEAESGNGDMRAGRTAAEFSKQGVPSSPDSFSSFFSSSLGTESYRCGTSPAASERHWLEACSAPAENGKATILSEIHF
jgi:hypothetical protein